MADLKCLKELGTTLFILHFSRKWILSFLYPCEAVSDETAAWAFPAAQGHLLRTWLSAGSEVTLPVAAGSSGLVQTNLPGNAFREMLHKSCFQLSGNSWILVLRGSIEQAQVERNGLFQWADYGTRN